MDVATSNEYTSCWDYFEKLTDSEKQQARCKICHKDYSNAKSQSTGLHRHLRTQHGLIRKIDSTQTRSQNNITSQPHSITENEEDTFPFMVAEMVAYDGIPIQKLCTSNSIQKLFAAKGFTPFKQPTSYTLMIHKFADEKRLELLKKIQNMKLAGIKFSGSFDEWTSFKNKRYLNLHLYQENESHNLGLKRIRGKCDATQLKVLIDEKLEEFSLSIEDDIVSIGSDGASVNIKYGQSVSAILQLCMNHGIHLAVLKVFYAKPLIFSESEVIFFY